LEKISNKKNFLSSFPASPIVCHQDIL